MLKSLKKNQIVIYVIALMLVAAGYLNYTTGNKQIAVSSDPEVTYKENIADIGDAALVNSNEVKKEENTTNNITKSEGVLVNNDGLEDNTKEINSKENNLETQDTLANADDYFSKSKLERDTMYSQMLETYQNIVNSNTVSEEQRAIATQEITNINNAKNGIMVCENLLSTKGFEKSIVFVNGDSVSVVVKTESALEGSKVAQIQNIVSREMQVKVENINITEKQ